MKGVWQELISGIFSHRQVLFSVCSLHLSKELKLSWCKRRTRRILSNLVWIQLSFTYHH